MEILKELEKEFKITGLDIDQISRLLNLNLKNILNGKEKLDMSDLLKIIDFINPSINRATELINIYKKDNECKI